MNTLEKVLLAILVVGGVIMFICFITLVVHGTYERVTGV